MTPKASDDVGTSGSRRSRVQALVTERAGEILDLAATLVRIPSDFPEHTELGVVDALSEAAGRLGLPTPEVIAARSDRPNLLIRVPGRTSGRRLILTAHTDTKPPGPREAWDADPWGGLMHDGYLVGLGSSDTKSALAAFLHAAAVLGDIGEPRRGELLILFTADEESAGEVGLRHVLDSGHMTAAGAIVGEPAGLLAPFDRIGLASRGLLGFVLQSRGTSRHSSISDIVPTINPVENLAEVLVNLRREPILAGRAHPLFPRGVTLNVATEISGGVASGIVPSIAESRGDLRLLPGITCDEAKAALDRAVEGLRLRGLGGDVELIFDADDWPGAEIEPDHVLARTLIAAASEVLARPVAPGGFPGATEAHLLARLGIPTIPAAGPGVISRAHVPNESVEVDAIIAATEIYALTALEFLQGDQYAGEPPAASLRERTPEENPW